MKLNTQLSFSEYQVLTRLFSSEELPGLHPVISAFTDSIVQRNERVRVSPNWSGNERTNQSIAFGPSPFPENTIVPFHHIMITLYLPSKLKTSIARKSLSQTIKTLIVNSLVQSDLLFHLSQKCSRTELSLIHI